MATSNAQQQHRSALKQYLRSHSNNTNQNKKVWEDKSPKEKGLDEKSKIQVESNNPSHVNSKKNLNSLKNCNLKKNTYNPIKLPLISKNGGRKVKVVFESLPDEIIRIIFWKLQIGDLINVSQVCKRWHRIAEDNLLWKHFYSRFVGATSKEAEDKTPAHELHSCCWKNLCLNRCKLKRDQIYLKKWKHPDSYTGLKQRPELTLSKVGVTFEISFIDSCGLSQSMKQSDIYWLTMSASVRWYDLTFPDIQQIKSLRIHACSPLMFYGPSKPAKDGISQKSLLMEFNGNLREFLLKEKPLGSDSHINIFEISKGLIIGLYQVDGELAFVTASLHYFNLISKCLSGTPRRCWEPSLPMRPVDDIDPHYGLHGYTCILQIRNMRQKLLDCKFTDLYTKKGSLVGGFAVYNPVCKDDKMTHIACVKEITFPWKTNLFKGVVQAVGILDVIMLDERGEPFWTISSAIKVEHSSQTYQFEFEPSNYRVVHYEDDQGKLDMEMGKLDDGGFYLSDLTIALSVSAINKTFNTSY
ncbi:unnamed protein product [Lymnaea stagnalis]|uniref:F-box domain-containing protein n=1 Tax=Lymnaea stagnalis TaxID=6523 RepID=A0AAV2IE41_LYMST